MNGQSLLGKSQLGPLYMRIGMLKCHDVSVLLQFEALRFRSLTVSSASKEKWQLRAE